MRSSKFKGSVFILQFVVTICSIIGLTMTVKAADEAKTFTVLNYNVAGLSEPFSKSKPSINTQIISPLLNDYDIVAVQDDFDYHDQLIKGLTQPHFTTTSGKLPMCDGMNFISKYHFYDSIRVAWKDRNGAVYDGYDQITPKGFMYTQYELEPGVYVDIYTLQTDTGDDEKSYITRSNNMAQLANYIETNSNGNAVIVMGDTNLRYTRKDDNFELSLLKRCELKDPWIEIIRNGSIPDDGDALMDESDKSGANYESGNKVFYRSSKSVDLTAISYKIEDTKFVDANGNQLSDHYPLAVQFKYAKKDNVQLSASFGGKGGAGFNDLQAISDSMPTKVRINWEKDIDSIGFTYEDGTILNCGEDGDYDHIMYLPKGEYINQMRLCKGLRNGEDRLFYVEFKTNKGFTLSGGQQTEDTVTLTAPDGWYIAGIFGRAGSKVEKLGAIYKPLPAK